MEKSIRIITDSSCDLLPELLQESDIEVVPLIVRFGTDIYADGKISAEAFWEKAAGPHPPQTSQPSIGTFQEVFERLVAQGNQVLCLTVTGKHSGTFNSARLAAQHFGASVCVLDSLSFSLGLGHQVLVAAQAAQAGRSMTEILALLEDLRARMRVWIIFDSLEHIRRGGRADAFVAVAHRMTRALNIKVIVNTVDGQLRLLSAARSFEGSLKRVLNLIEGLGPLEQLAVIHTRSHDRAHNLAARLADRFHFPQERIWVRETGAVLSTHAGPGVIGVVATPVSPTG